MKEAYVKLYRGSRTSAGGTSGWRLASSPDICSEEYSSVACKDFKNFEIENSFKTEVAGRIFIKVIRYGECRSAETILLALIRFDGIRPTLLVHSFRM